MPGRIRIALLIIAALLFGAAQAACACAPYEHDAIPAATAHDASHGHHHDALDGQSAHTAEHGLTPAHSCSDDDGACGFHSVHELAADTAAPTVLTAPVQIAVLAVVPAAMAPPAPHFDTAGGASLLSQPPPRSTPVSMKVRLLN